MTKLSKAQEAILNEAKESIDTARACNSFEEWVYKTETYWRGRYTLEEAIPKIREFYAKHNNWRQKYYEAYKTGKVLVTANTRTIAKLEELGLIRIIDEGGSYPDWIEVIGY